MLKTEDVKLHFTDDAVVEIAEIAFTVNERTENIGARRLHTVLERLLEIASFEASDKAGQSIEIDAGYVETQLPDLTKEEDLRKYIL
jgi:ATP-dependent HslUV protease ATP-binding subunit HslU